MSGTTLSDYFENERPGKLDMCIIVRAVVRTAVKKKAVYPDTEHVWYDSELKKVYVMCQSEDASVCGGLYRYSVNEFMHIICNQCRYAGDGTYDMMRILCKLTDAGDYESCIRMTDGYIEQCGSTDRGKGIAFILCAVCVAVIEAVYLSAMNIKYY